MFALYRKSQQIQYDWIRNHPFQWLAFNGALIAVGFAYVAYQDRKEMRKLETETPQQAA